MLSGPLAATEDFITVEDNIAFSGMQNHMIVIFPEPGAGGADSLVLSCREGETDAFLDTDGYYGTDGVVRIRWKGMDGAEFVPSRAGVGGTSVFFAEPRTLIEKLYDQGEVVVSVNGYAVSGAARFIPDHSTYPAIEALAEECGWSERLHPPQQMPEPAEPQGGAPAGIWAEPLETFLKPLDAESVSNEAACASAYNGSASVMWGRARGMTLDQTMNIAMKSYPIILHDWVQEMVGSAFSWQISPGLEEQAIRAFAQYHENQFCIRYFGYAR